MAVLTAERAIEHVNRVLADYQRAVSSSRRLTLPNDVTNGKLYEAWVLVTVLDRLRTDEGYSVALRGSSELRLKSSPGPINRGYPHFELSARGRPTLEVWTDIEFLALSWSQRKTPGAAPQRADFHELDIVVVPDGTRGRPSHDEIRLGVECKNTGYMKELLRAILGVRRELSLLSGAESTAFARWPAPAVPASPASCLLVYCTDPRVVEFSGPGDVFGIQFIHEPLPV